MTAMDRRSLMTAMVGACIAAGAISAAATSASALPVPQPAKREPDIADALADSLTDAGDGEARVHNAQYIVIRRRPRRRWFWGRRRRRWW